MLGKKRSLLRDQHNNISATDTENCVDAAKSPILKFVKLYLQLIHRLMLISF